MEEKNILKGRIRDLASKAANQGYVTRTRFLSLSEQNLFQKILQEEKYLSAEGTIFGSAYFFYGGQMDSDRKCAFFLPDYYDQETYKVLIDQGEEIICLHLYPKAPQFADTFTHRDVLGSLMSLGLEREEFGDILVKGPEAYVFLLKEVAPIVKEKMSRIKHTDIRSEILKPSECPWEREFIEKEINIASNRLDNILAEVFHLSRGDAQNLIRGEHVFVEGETVVANAHELKEGARVSIEGFGKFLFLGIKKETRKGRFQALIKQYR